MRQSILLYIVLSIFCVLDTGCAYARSKKSSKNRKERAESVLVEKEAIPAEEGEVAAAEESVEDVSMRVSAVLEANNGAAYKRDAIEGEAVAFNEVWAFYTNFYKADENKVDSNAPLTDVALFGAEIGSYGNLEGIPSKSNLRRAADGNFAGRVHLTFACSSRGVTHFCLDPKYDIREPLVNAIIAASRGFDGVVCDLEYVPIRDKGNFLTFLKEIKDKLGKRMLTVCVPARTKILLNDVFPYKEISDIADRVFIMAYDEHWSTSAPGPVASYAWCEKVASYAASTIPKEKLIVGIPFYARAWVDKTKNPVGAWRYSKFNRHLAENGVSEIERTEDGDGHVKYTVTVNVDAYFDDAYSLYKKCMMYAAKDIENMGVWCIGQDDSEFWKWVKVKE